jgi:hypothetical protein
MMVVVAAAAVVVVNNFTFCYLLAPFPHLEMIFLSEKTLSIIMHLQVQNLKIPN